MSTGVSCLVAVIDPVAVYNFHSAAQVLGLKKNCVPRECRLGRLKYSKRAGRAFILGEWLLDWIKDGVVDRRRMLEAMRESGKPKAA